MRLFEHKSAESFQEASELLKKSSAQNGTVIAGGSDLIGGLKTAILPDEISPEVLIDIKTIKDGAYIKEENDTIKIGALTRLVDIENHADLNSELPILSEAARSVATPIIRNVATIGGNICQDVRCWYYRYPHEVGDRFNCARKTGSTCYAINGENRYHSIFGGMKVHASACSTGCPAGTDIPAYMAEIRKGNWEKAAEIIMKVNPMPMLTSRICPHPCQDNCNQNEYGECVSIHCVERTVGDYILNNTDKFYAAPENETGKKFAIIGAGPGGLAAAYYLRKAGHTVTVFDSHEKAGGVLYYGIPHYRLPKNIVDAFTSALEKMGVVFRLNTTIGKDVSVDSVVNDNDSVYFGTGAWKQPLLGIQGENLTEFGLNFLVEVNTFLRDVIDDEVLVCGGGNVAMDVALTARRMGAKVRLVCLEQRNEMPASKEEVDRAEEEGVEIINGWGLKSIVKDEAGKVCGLESMKCLSVRDENGRFSPKYDDNDITVFKAKSIILATGQKVDLAFLGDDLGAQLQSARGLIEADADTYQTKNDKIFAGGDAVTGPNIAIRAIRAGGAAAKAMSAKLGYKIVAEKSAAKGLSFDVEGIKVKENAKLKERPVADRTLTDEDALSLSMEEAQKEASRCMNCGCYSVNASDISPVLVALDANIITTNKEIKARDFFTTELKATDMLEKGELVKEIQIPKYNGYKSGYLKLRVREAVDFAIVSLAYAYKMDGNQIADVKLVAGGVAPVPYPLDAVEDLLKGKVVSDAVIEQASELAVEGAVAMDKNTYKIQQLKALVKQALSECK